MRDQKTQTLSEHLSEIKHPRIERTKRHKLLDILVIAILRGDLRGRNLELVAKLTFQIPSSLIPFNFATSS